MPIYVETDPKLNLYSAKMAGSAAAAAEAKMAKMVKDAVDNAAGYTSAKTADAKGYFVRLKIAKLEQNGSTKCTVSGEIERYPKTMTKTKGKGAEMVTTGWSSSAEATGTGQGSIIQCVEATVEAMLPKGFQAMDTDMKRR